MLNNQDSKKRKYFSAEVFLMEGSQNYDIMDWNKGQAINDLVTQ